MDKSVQFLSLNICYVIYVLFESIFVFILFIFKKKHPNISGIRVVHILIYIIINYYKIMIIIYIFFFFDKKQDVKCGYFHLVN